METVGPPNPERRLSPRSLGVDFNRLFEGLSPAELPLRLDKLLREYSGKLDETGVVSQTRFEFGREGVRIPLSPEKENDKEYNQRIKRETQAWEDFKVAEVARKRTELKTLQERTADLASQLGDVE